MLVHGRFNLELTVEIVLGRIDGDTPADLAVEVEPQEILISRGMLITVIRKIVPVVPNVPDVPSLAAVAVPRNDRDFTGRNIYVSSLCGLVRLPNFSKHIPGW